MFKKLLTILLIIMLMLNYANAAVLNDSQFFQDFLRLGENYKLSFNASFGLNIAYPFDDRQAQIFTKALNPFNMDCSIECANNTTNTISILNYQDIPVYSDATLQYNDDFYTLSNLLDTRLLHSSGDSFLSKALNNKLPFDREYSFTPHKAKASHTIAINQLIALLENTKQSKANFNIKGIGIAKSYTDYTINKNNIDKLSDILISVVFAGQSANTVKNKSPKPYGIWEIRDYANENGGRIALRLKGKAEYADGVKRSIDYFVSFNENMQLYSIKAEEVSLSNKSDYYITELNLDESLGLIIDSLYERKLKKSLNSENISCNLRYGKEGNKRAIKGEYAFLQSLQEGKQKSSEGFNVKPNLMLIQNNDIYEITGNAGFNINKNDINIVDMQIKLGEIGTTGNLESYCKAMLKALQNGGIKQNVSELDSLTKSFFGKSMGNLPLQYIQFDEWNKQYIDSIANELIKNAAANTLKAMLKYPEKSYDFLKLGMTEDDWNNFLLSLENKGE